MGELGFGIHQVVSSAGDLGITAGLAGSDQPLSLYAPRWEETVARSASFMTLVASLGLLAEWLMRAWPWRV